MDAERSERRALAALPLHQPIDNMKLTVLLLALFCASLLAGRASAQETLAYSGKEPVAILEMEEPIDLYEGGRGLITLEGPSGLFINPTSGTLPEGAMTLQYCFFLPENDWDTVGHGLLFGYGITDWLEVGAIANFIDNGADPSAVGPLVRIRLLKDTATTPEFSIGYYGRYGNDLIKKSGLFAAMFKRIPIGDESGFVRSVGLHGGFRNVWEGKANNSTHRFYGGAEVQLPLRLYMVGEVSTDQNAAKTPYSFGGQWRMGGINISVAGIQPGGLSSPGFYFGVGSQLQF
jgi:hypothetical protein